LEWRLSCKINADTPGVYVLLCAWLEEPFGLAMHRVTVGGTIPPDPTPGPQPPPGPSQNPYPTPTATWQTSAAGVSKIKTSRADATSLSALYDSAKRLVASAPAARAAGTKPEIGTTAELREWLISNGRPLGLQGKYPGLADAVDAYLGRQLGTAIRDVKKMVWMDTHAKYNFGISMTIIVISVIVFILLGYFLYRSIMLKRQSMSSENTNSQEIPK
jgi:hypothetical protein